MKPVLITNWGVFEGRLWGNVSGHPRFDDGTFVRTSTIQDDGAVLKQGDVVPTQNTNYLLGTPAGRT